MFENEEYERLRLGFVYANKNFEDLTSEDFDLLNDLYRVGLEEDRLRMETEEDYPLPDYDEDEERKLDLKRFYYGFCLEGTRNPGRVSVFLEHYYYDENLEKDVRKKTTICLNEETDEGKLGAFSMTIKSIEKKIIKAINFGCDWADEGKPGVNEMEHLSKWVDYEDFYLFIQMLLTMHKLEYYRTELYNEIQRKEVDEEKINVFSFDSYMNKQFVLDALEAVGITADNVYILGDRRKSALMGFVEACIEGLVLPKVSKDLLCGEIAKRIKMNIERRLQSGSEICRKTKTDTEKYVKKHYKRASSDMTNSDK